MARSLSYGHLFIDSWVFMITNESRCSHGNKVAILPTVNCLPKCISLSVYQIDVYQPNSLLSRAIYPLMQKAVKTSFLITITIKYIYTY